MKDFLEENIKVATPGETTCATNMKNQIILSKIAFYTKLNMHNISIRVGDREKKKGLSP